MKYFFQKIDKQKSGLEIATINLFFLALEFSVKMIHFLICHSIFIHRSSHIIMLCKHTLELFPWVERILKPSHWTFWRFSAGISHAFASFPDFLLKSASSTSANICHAPPKFRPITWNFLGNCSGQPLRDENPILERVISFSN